MNLINTFIADFVSTISKLASDSAENIRLLNLSPLQVAIDVLLVSILFYYIFVLLKASRAKYIVVGLIILALLFLVSKWLNLFALRWLLDKFLTLIIVAIPIIFQQELREGLEKIGHPKLFVSKLLQEADILVTNIVDAVAELAKKKKGALIVLQQEIPLNEYLETGIKLNANVSKELLLSIFEPHSPLHDGAIVIKNGKILAAAVTLPHSFKKYDAPLGTRHKAAISLSDTTDAKVIVVSEERGTISLAEQGHLEKNVNDEKLTAWLIHLLKPKKSKK